MNINDKYHCASRVTNDRVWNLCGGANLTNFNSLLHQPSASGGSTLRPPMHLEAQSAVTLWEI